jgi:hypothetical protein
LVELDGRWIAGQARPDEELAELCYIPVFGGGYGLGASEVMGWPVSRKRFFLDWLHEKREAEVKGIQGKGSSSGGRGRYGAGQPGPPDAGRGRNVAPPSLSRPAVPKR